MVTMLATRDGVGRALLELGKTNPQVVVLTADLAESTKVLVLRTLCAPQSYNKDRKEHACYTPILNTKMLA